MGTGEMKYAKRSRLLKHGTDTTKVFIAAVYVALVFIPLARMFASITPQSIRKAMTSPNFWPAIRNSLAASALTTAITLALALTLAVCTQRCAIRGRSLFPVIFVLPMLIPSISNGMGLVVLFGNSGIISRLTGWEIGLYGLKGIVMGSVFYAFPVAYLMLADVMKYEDATPYEAARALGIGKLRQFTGITLPYLRKPLISVVFSTFTLVATDYGVPLMVGGKYVTVPVVMYQEVIGQLDFGKGAVYGSILLIPAVIAFIIDLLNKDRGNSSYTLKPIQPTRDRLKTAAAQVLCILTSLFVVLPLVSFVIVGFTADYPTDMTFTLENIAKALKLHAAKYLGNSVIIAFCVSTVGTVIAFLSAYMTARMKSKASRFLHLSAITSAAIPGIVLGLSYVLAFKGSVIYGTLIILVMVNIVHFISSPYLMGYNSLSKINENLEGVGQTLGISRPRMILDVLVPQCASTLAEMFVYFFVNCMMTISAVSFLATTANKPVSLMINQFEAQMQLECAAIVSLAIFGVNVLPKGVERLFRNTNWC